MKDLNIVICGVGGQGTLLASRILGHIAMELGHDVKVSEVHGMSQRGGSVITYVRMGEKVYSPMIEQKGADFVLAFEELEALRKRIADRNSRSIGLTNLDRRLRLRYPEETGLRICSIKNLGTSVSFCIPYKKYTPDAPQTGKTE